MPTPARYPDWRLRLDALLLERMHTPFAWGQHDCCLFAADAVQALTGHDPAALLRGTYSSLRAALVLLERRGGLQAIATRALGDTIEAPFAQVGDVVMVQSGLEWEGEPMPSLAVCGGSMAWAPGAEGLVAVRRPSWLLAWRVGA